MSTEQLQAISDELPDALKGYVDKIELPEVEEEDNNEEQVESRHDHADPLVDKANKIGWVSKDEWVAQGKDPDQWVDHAEYIRRKPLFDKIHSLNKALKDKDAKIDAVSKYAQKAADFARDKVIKEYEEQRLKAVEDGDLDAFEKADKQLQEARKEPVVEDGQPEPEIPAVITEFTSRNPWFEKDKMMTIAMVETTRGYTASGMTLEQAMEKAEAEVKREFAHKFENPNRQKPAAVAGGGGEPKAKTYGYGDLNAEQRDVWASLRKSGMKLEKYIADLREMGELK